MEDLVSSLCNIDRLEEAASVEMPAERRGYGGEGCEGGSEGGDA